MTPQSCHGCTHFRGSLIYKLACYRPRSFQSGLVVPATADAGFPAEFETHPTYRQEGRADGDICGPEFIHFKAGEGVI